VLSNLGKLRETDLRCKNFDAQDAHFDYLSLFSGTQAEKVGNPEKKL
jgi:hypothetical protein